MAHGPRGKYALDKVWDRHPTTPGQRLRLPDPDFDEPLLGIGEVESTSLPQLQRDEDLLRRLVELLPLDEVRAAVQSYARQSEVLTEALGGRELVAAVLGELDGALNREERALLHSELEHELGGPLEDSGEGNWSEREAKHARWELTRSWVAQVLAAVDDQGGPVPLDGKLYPRRPGGRKAGWDASPEDVEDALLASIAVKPDSLEALRKTFHARVVAAVSRDGSLPLPGRVELASHAGELLARPYR
jgi:hypothetical protein